MFFVREVHIVNITLPAHRIGHTRSQVPFDPHCRQTFDSQKFEPASYFFESSEYGHRSYSGDVYFLAPTSLSIENEPYPWIQMTDGWVSIYQCAPLS